MGCNVRDSIKLHSQTNRIKTPQTGRGEEERNRRLTVAAFEVQHKVG
ncbi:TPA: hypothetical protein MFM43_001323 [Klebsiella pneumoniae]|nr:hypothetical protein UUU_13300 [Klebsiella pneumoniae subsp. pneumoniae DSM 30104 = JCM 1662 = NBRC 14940]HBW8269016.1 hypothetical protein [Klebsiella pneumoniae]HBW8913123.1 hypothetical protein [Klebsiella pneumoniae subsp. pneumoniae 1158]HBW8274091.1 hypothetical protein [Klebsiella pneumoniae]HBW8281933.1 hypothetical protein [Klebsiella pneumoniae]